MNISEFKAWLDGFKESIDVAPNERQWKRVLSVLEGVLEQQVFTVPMTPHIIQDTVQLPYKPGTVICNGNTEITC